MVKFIRIVFQVFILYLFSFVGSWVVDSFSLQFPGSIVGLILLFVCLYFKIVPVQFIKDGAGFLLAFLALFFVPATVGIMEYPEIFSWVGLGIILSIAISTIISIVVSGKFCQYLEKKLLEKEQVE
ncbi:holin-like protein [Psychrobacillus sp. OK028]|uniref:CidA/LrgA family protein n=1 Tax=Psychrobacillus sp. OK028 TaxID=1884359 RepID=UPI00088F94CE|nr:CidA/LrgA family holin-like protein [Psychrobacillus sp. OK028]SDM49606.1 holin-like protein [Psychrobacillus sp. OK028]